MPLVLSSKTWQPLSGRSGKQLQPTCIQGCANAVSLRLTVRRTARLRLSLPWSASCQPTATWQALHSTWGAQPGVSRQRNGCGSMRRSSRIVCYQGNPGQVAAPHRVEYLKSPIPQAPDEGGPPPVMMSAAALAAADRHTVPILTM